MGALRWPTNTSHKDSTGLSAFPGTGWSQALEDITVLTLPLMFCQYQTEIFQQRQTRLIGKRGFNFMTAARS